MGRVIITPYGGIGNQMFQYMTAMSLQDRVRGLRIRGHDLPAWGLVARDVPEPGKLTISIRRLHRIPIDEIAAVARAERRTDILLEGMCCRLEYWQHMLDAFRSTFPRSHDVVGGRDDELVINIRGNEILAGAHTEYMPLPIAVYDGLLALTGLSPVFVGQLGDDRYTAALRHRFPDARFIVNEPPLGDFHFVRASRHIVPAISTYSWLAAWLSEEAERVWLAEAGVYHQAARPDIDLLPRSDPRYRLLASDLLRWDATDEELDRLIEAPAEDFGFVPARKAGASRGTVSTS